MRRLIAPVLALLLVGLAGCTGIFAQSAQAVKGAVLGPPPLHFTAREVYGRPYYQMRLDWPDGAELLVMGHAEGGRTLWYDGGSHLFVLRHGLVVKTDHLDANLDATALPADDPFQRGLQHLHGPLDVTRHVDLSPGYRYGVPVQVHLQPAGMTTLNILGTPHRVRIVDATVRAPRLHFSAHNRYWVDPASGVVWKSRQTLPGGPTLTLTALRPYTGATP